MAGDPELKAMTDITTALSELDKETTARVLRWARERFAGVVERDQGPGKGAAAGATGDYEDVAALYAAASPTTEPERALVVGYWFQVEQGVKDFDSQRVNTELKQMGHGIGNITDAFSRLINRKPQYVIQIRKSGAARQARKQYRLTNEGIKRVQVMLAGVHDEAAE